MMISTHFRTPDTASARRLACLLPVFMVVGLVCASLHADGARTCVHKPENETEIRACNASCSFQLRNTTFTQDGNQATERLQLAKDCWHHCRNAQIQPQCHCFGAACLDSLPCFTACGLAGAYTAIASRGRHATTCMRMLVAADTSLATRIYWLPLARDLPSLGLISSASMFFSLPESKFNSTAVNLERSVAPQYKVYSASPSSFPVSTPYSVSGRAGATPTPYNTVFHPQSVRYGVYPGQDTLIYNRLREEHTTLFSSPVCNQMTGDGVSQCADPLYTPESRSGTVQYHNRLIVTRLAVEHADIFDHRFLFSDSAEENIAVASSRRLYRLNMRLSWAYHPFDLYKPKAMMHLFGKSCMSHSCWCWESCAVIHALSVTISIGGQQVTLPDFVVTEETAPFIGCPTFSANTSKNLNFTVDAATSELFAASESARMNITVGIRSYYEVDTHFGPRWPEARFTQALDTPLWHSTPPSTQATFSTSSTSSARSASSTRPKTEPSSTEPSYSDDGGSTAAIVAPVVVICLSIAVVAAIVAFLRAWNYRKWRPQCVKRNVTLEKLQEFRVSTGFQSAANDSYQSAARFADSCSDDDWPTVQRGVVHLETQLGSGQFGEVFRARVFNLNAREASTQVAVKVLKTGSTAKDRKDFLREAALLKTFRHPNVIRLLGVCLDDDPKMILLELMDGGDLLTYLQANQPGAARPAWDDAEYIDIALDVAAGLRYLETEKYIHRDIAARNCLVSFNPQNSSLAVKPSSSGRIVKVADFGLARDIDSHDSYILNDEQALVPVRWMAPESIQQKLFTHKSDTWSFGILLWEIYTYGQMPYGEKTTVFDIYKFITMGGILEQPQFCPTAMYKMMKQTWANSPADRPTFRQLHDHLTTFQKSLSRRKTLLTTLVSFASVSGIGDVDKSQLPHIPAPQRVAIPPRPSCAEHSVFGDDSSDLSDNAFESTPCDSPFDSPLQPRRTGGSGAAPPVYRASPLIGGSNLLVPRSNIRQQRRSHHKSRSDTAVDELGDSTAFESELDDPFDSPTNSPIQKRRNVPPLTDSHLISSNTGIPSYHIHQQRRRQKSRSRSQSREDVIVEEGTGGRGGRSGYSYVRQENTGSEGDSPDSSTGPVILITEYSSRKPLSPIVSASSVPDEPLGVGLQRKSRSESSGSTTLSARTETSL